MADITSYIKEGKSSNKPSVKQYFFSKAKNELLTSIASTNDPSLLPILLEIDTLIEESKCFMTVDTCLNHSYEVMLDFRDLGDKIDPALFFCGDSLHLNWNQWTIEKMTGSSLPTSAQHFMKQAAIEAHNRLLSLSSDQFLAQYGHFFEFYTYNKVFEEALALHFEGHTYEVACLLFPFFEHTIGDMICCVKGSVGVESGVKWGDNQDPCPARITEILEHRDTEILLGKDMVFVLKLLIGPMTGFNLRNLTWHGFIYPSEFPPCFMSLIFAICISLPNLVAHNWKRVKYNHSYSGVPSKSRNWFGSSLEQSNAALLNVNVPANVLPYLPAVASQLRYHYRLRIDLFRIFSKFQCAFPDFNLSSVEANEWLYLKKLIRHSGFPLVGQMDHWCRCVEYYQAGKYFEFVAFSIPIIEHSLRRAFGCENKSADRIISAEPTSLMTILDIILAYRLEQGVTNELVPVLGDKVTSLLWDLFVWSDGSLLRDFLAHGTVPPNRMPTEYAHQVLVIMVYLMAKFNCDEKCNENSIVQACVRYTSDFVPNFNPKNVLLYAMKKVYTSLGTFAKITDIIKQFEWPKGKSKDEGEPESGDQNASNSNSSPSLTPSNTQTTTPPLPLASQQQPTVPTQLIQLPPQPPTLQSSDSTTPQPTALSQSSDLQPIADSLADLTLNEPSTVTDDSPSRCQVRALFYLDTLLNLSNDINTTSNNNNNTSNFPTNSVIPHVRDLLFNKTALSAPISAQKLEEFQPKFALWSPKVIQNFIENLITTCAHCSQFITAVTEEHDRLYELVITRRAWKSQREMFARLKKVFPIFPATIHLIMAVVESSFHLADSLQRVMKLPTDEIPQLETTAVFIRKLNECVGMMTTTIRSHWWANTEDLFECFIGRKFDTSFAAVDSKLYTPPNPDDLCASVIDFQHMNKRDKKNLENSLQDYYAEFSHAAPTPPAPSPPDAFPCEVCGVTFPTAKIMKKHVKDMDHRKWKIELAKKAATQELQVDSKVEKNPP